MLATLGLAAALAGPSSALNDGDRPYQLALSAELGFLGVAKHNIQFGKDGSTLDYVEEGGQDNLFPFMRMSADLVIRRHTVVFLVQPLDLRTTDTLRRDILVDGETFTAGTPMNFRYGFTFYRASYLYDLAKDPNRELAIGLSLQLRNATIDFASSDGRQLISNRNIGPVPIIKLRGMTPVGQQGAWVGAEVDGFYAPIRYINGSNSDVEGAILDASVRAGLNVDAAVAPFVNLRVIAGGSEGTSNNFTPPGDGFTSNWLSFVSVSLGATVR